MPTGKPDAVLSDGTEVFVDLNKITVKEYRASLSKDQTFDDEYVTIQKVTGLTDVSSLGFEDYKRIVTVYVEKARAPITNPPSASESSNS